jgi:integrase
MSDTIRAALEKAAKRLCICDGECFETRHGMMHGPCERRMGEAGDAITTFLNAPPPPAQTIRLYLGEVSPQGMRDIYAYHRWLAAAVEAAAKELTHD